MHTSVRLHPDKFSLRFFGMNAGRAGLLLAILLVGCTKQELPELGPRLSQTAALGVIAILAGIQSRIHG